VSTQRYYILFAECEDRDEDVLDLIAETVIQRFKGTAVRISVVEADMEIQNGKAKLIHKEKL
jgi:hypothetical protein